MLCLYTLGSARDSFPPEHLGGGRLAARLQMSMPTQFCPPDSVVLKFGVFFDAVVLTPIEIHLRAVTCGCGHVPFLMTCAASQQSQKKSVQKLPAHSSVEPSVTLK